MNIKNVDIIVPSFRSKDLTSLAIKSFEKYRNNFNFRYIVVENSQDDGYRDYVCSISNRVIWVQNPIPSLIDSRSPTVRSDANASGIEKGLEYAISDYVFICHNDVVACHADWMNYLVSKIDEQTPLVGVREHDDAAHVIGVLVETKLAKSVSMYPKLNCWDVGDKMTHYCNENGLKYFICNNTNNNPEAVNQIKAENYKNVPVDRVLNDDGDVIYMHLGRGTDKQFNKYFKRGKLFIPSWKEFINESVL